MEEALPTNGYFKLLEEILQNNTLPNDTIYTKSHKFGEFGYLKKNGIVHKTLKIKKGKAV